MENFISSNEMDISTMCRLCFSRLKKPRNIFDTPGLLNEILKFADIEINVEDDLPKEICDRCNGKLEFIEAFRRQIREADYNIKAFVAASRRRSLSNESKAVIVDSSAESERSGENIEDSTLFDYRDSPTSMLVESYDILTNQCRLRSSIETPEDFMLPSSFAIIPTDELTEKNSVASVSVKDRKNSIPGIWATDPLNLLKVKSVRPLRSSDFSGCDLRSVSSTSSFSCRRRRKHSTGLASSKIAKINPEITRDAVESLFSSSSSSSSSFSSSLSLSSESIRKSSETLPNKNFHVENQIRRKPESFLSTADKKSLAKCPVCEKNFANIHGVRIHIGVVHQSANCQLCGAPMSTRAEFKEHMQLHLFPSDKTKRQKPVSKICSLPKKPRSTL